MWRLLLCLSIVSISCHAVLQPMHEQQKPTTNLFEQAVRSFIPTNPLKEKNVTPGDVTNATRLWAVLVAGSNSWWNYRHQSDICHAYQIMKNHGIPDERIIVMMYDDIAYNEQNPTPGIVINKPGGHDVYKGVQKDYKGDDVTALNFLNIIQGHSQNMSSIGSGKVLASGPDDHVFINFADHGAPGLIAFPNDVLYSQDLITALNFMSNNKMFKKLVLYIEACEAGSMFDGLLPANISIYAATASNADESSYACYYDDKRQTYLGDVFSVNWMEDTDANNIETETISSQIKDVTKETNTSHVMYYGDSTIAQLDVGQFQGLQPALVIVPRTGRKAVSDAVRSEDVPMHILAHRVQQSASDEERQRLTVELGNVQMKRSLLRTTVSSIIQELDGMTPSLYDKIMKSQQRLKNRQCAKAATESFRKSCFNFTHNEYALRMVPILVNSCELGIPESVLLRTIEQVCHRQRAQLITGVL